LKVLVLGGAGQVARAVSSTVPEQHKITVKSHEALDIADAVAVDQMLESLRPDWVVNAAAYTWVDRAEDEREKAFEVNDTAVGVLERAASRTGCRLLHLSTDFVFDGRSNLAYLPTDETNPLTVYGLSKRDGELKVLNGVGNGIVLRTAWVYAASGRNFVLTMLRLMAEREEVKVVCDQIGTPTSAASVASAIWGLIDAKAPSGAYHWTDLGIASWYDFAVAIQDEALVRGLLQRTARVMPIPTSDFPARARRPTFSVLNSESTRTLIKKSAQHWRHNLREMLDDVRAE
jgi:dTDP-4-dehydrorhamnose reductase